MTGDASKRIQMLFPRATEHTLQPMHWQPPADVYQTRRGWLLKFDLAGVRIGDVELTLQGSTLTLRGRRRDWVVEELQACSSYSLEIAYTHFERQLTLPGTLEGAEVHTSFRDGMLLVELILEKSAP